MANTHLTITPSSGSTRTQWTWSAWIKRTALANQNLWGVNVSSSSYAFIGFRSDKLRVQETYLGSETMELRTTRVFRDTNAWYHIVVAQDTTQSTASERLKIYINGVQETAFDVSTYPSPQNYTPYFLNTNTHVLGRDIVNNNNNFDGCMSHVHLTDDYVYDASAFGQYDANGVWTIKTSPSVTYGTNGFFILEDGNSVTDQSGNSNNWTVGGGTLTNTEDNPSNVFATMNPLNYTSSAVTYSNGNTKGTYPGFWIASQGTIGGMNGKYFWEAKVNSGNNANLFYGICRPNIDLDTSPQNQTGVICQHINGDRYVDGTYTASTAEALVNGDILGVALDLDSATKTVKFYKNGALLSSGSSINLTSTYDNEFVLPFFAGNNSSASSIWETNFGNGYFSTTAVASAGTNASGIGIFEYDVPTGYTALSTKGLNL